MRDFFIVMRDGILGAIVISLAIFSCIAFSNGCFEGMTTDKCVYDRLISYYPTRALGCELTKKRW